MGEMLFIHVNVSISFLAPSFIIKDLIMSGIVGSFLLYDNSGYIKIVLWGNQATIIEEESFKEEEIVQIINRYSKKESEGLEVHLSKIERIVLAPQNVDEKSITLRKKKKKQNYFAHPAISELYDKEGFIRSISGIAEFKDFKELNSRDKGKLFLLKLTLTDGTASILVNIWGMDAIKYFSLFDSAKKVKFFNVFLRESKYSNEKEIIFGKKSRLEIQEE